jgi:putative thioredoxin
MNASPFIVETTAENFAEIVARSAEVPVLMDFWAPWCGPCQMLLPIVTRLAEQYQGKFILAKVNIDEQQGLAVEFGVRSVPTVKLFRNGQVVEEFLGAQPESVIRRLLDQHIARESDHVRATAAAALARGDTEQALESLRAAAEMDPDNPRVALDLAQALLAAGEVDQAEATLGGLPIDLMADPQVAVLRAELLFTRAAATAPARAQLERAVAANPADLAARYQLAARMVQSEELEAALEQLLEILRRDRSFGDDAGRKGMLAVFDILGGRGELVSRYRPRMFNAMH